MWRWVCLDYLKSFKIIFSQQTAFQQIALGLITSGQFMAAVTNGNFTRDNWYNDTSGQLYLPSPSVDPRNPSFAGMAYVGTHNYSGYYVSVSLSLCFCWSYCSD